MSDLLIGLMGIAAAILLSFIGIAIAVFFGLKTFRTDIKGELSTITEKVIIIQQTAQNVWTDIKGELSTIKEKVIVIEGTAQNVWDVIKRSPLVGATGTVEINLKNLGKVKITAEPHLDNTIYYLVAEKAVFDGERIDKLSKETNFEQKEKDLFSGKIPVLSTPIPNRLKMEVPCTESSVCTKYISLFLQWLDSVYFKSVPKVEDFEEPIKLTDSN